jgi:hypothetical protein
MPITFQQVSTSSGHATMRTLVSGVLTLDEANQYVKAFCEAGPYHGRPNCGVLAPGCEIPAESRKAMSQLKPHFWPVAAVVVPSMALRMVTTFMIRIIGHGNIKIYGTEAEAMEWLNTAIPAANKKSAEAHAPS